MIIIKMTTRATITYTSSPVTVYAPTFRPA
jgi:hypothetical protein